MHIEQYDEWAGIADAFLEAAGFGDGPTDPWELAACYDLRVAHGGSRGCTCVVEDVIFADLTLPEPRLRADLAHELGHVALEVHGYENVQDEAAASWVGAALLCPTRSLKRDIRNFGWDLDALRTRYNVSWELAARRVVDVRSAATTIVDNGRVSARSFSYWVTSERLERPTQLERELISGATRLQAHYSLTPAARAWWIPGENEWRRVIAIVALDELDRADECARSPISNFR